MIPAIKANADRIRAMSNARTPITLPVATEPSNRPSSARRNPPTTSEPNSVTGTSGPMSSRLPKFTLREGTGNGSPSTTRIIRSTPAEMPPAKSPSLNFGVMTSSMIRREVTSVSAPSRP